MKMMYFFLLIFLLTVSASFADWKDYKYITINNLNKLITEKIADDDAKSSLTFFNGKFRLNITIDSYPINIDNETISNRNTYLLFTNAEDNISKYFSYQLKYKHKNMNYILIFQNNIVPYFLKEVKLNSKVELYIVIGMYNDFNKNVYIFVNEFATK